MTVSDGQTLNRHPEGRSPVANVVEHVPFVGVDDDRAVSHGVAECGERPFALVHPPPPALSNGTELLGSGGQWTVASILGGPQPLIQCPPPARHAARTTGQGHWITLIARRMMATLSARPASHMSGVVLRQGPGVDGTPPATHDSPAWSRSDKEHRTSTSPGRHTYPTYRDCGQNYLVGWGMDSAVSTTRPFPNLSG